MRRMYSQNQLDNQIKEVKKDINTLVDSDGNERFVEGDIELSSAIPEEITKTYGKWSLSGSHLLVVLCLDIAVKNFETQTALCNITLPDYIIDKVVPLFSSVVDRKGFLGWNDDYSTQTIECYLTKSTNKLGLNLYVTANPIATFHISLNLNSVNIGKTRHVRINFDLLID